MVELLQSKSIIAAIILILGVSYIGSNNIITLGDEKSEVQINA